MINRDTHYFKGEEVKAAVRGRWIEVLGGLAPELDMAFEKLRKGTQVPCPVCQGKTRFRLFRDVAERGAGICNQCGAQADGFAMLMWIRGWDFRTAMEEVAEQLGMQPYEKWAAKKQRAPVHSEAKSSKPMATTPPSAAADKEVASASSKVTNSYLAAKHGDDDFGQPASLTAPSDPSPVVQAHSAPYPELDEDTASHDVSLAAEEYYSQAITACGESPSLQTRGLLEAKPAAPALRAVPAPAQPQKAMKRELTARDKWLKELQEQSLAEATERDARSEASIEKVWEESIPITSEMATKGRMYLESRGIKLAGDRMAAIVADDCVRFHPNLPYYASVEVETEGPGGSIIKKDRVIKKGEYPALICAIRSKEGELMTVHRTYIAKNGKGKARVECARKMMTVPGHLSVSGGAIRLGKAKDGVIGVAEGLETALSAMRGSGIPSWSVVNATLLKAFEPPAGVHTLVVWADKDKSMTGEIAAQHLKERMEKIGVKVIVMMPPMPIPPRQKGVDWNDVLLSQGMLGFPRQRQMMVKLGKF